MQCLGEKDAGTEFLAAHLIIPKQHLILALHWMNNLLMKRLKSTTAQLLGWIHKHPSQLHCPWLDPQASFTDCLSVLCHFGCQCLLQEAVAIVCSIKCNNKRCFHLTRYRMNVIKDCKQSGFHQHSNMISPLYEQCSHIEFRDIDFDVEDLR